MKKGLHRDDIVARSDLNAVLMFADGKYFFGRAVGFFGNSIGEICFNTAQTGYQEIISDPSYAEQIINFTFPHIGNIGTNKHDNEAKIVFSKGVIVANDITNPSSYRSEESLNDWLIRHKVVGIAGIDTREVTTYIRNQGAQAVIIQHYQLGEKMDLGSLYSKVSVAKDLQGRELSCAVSRANDKSNYNYQRHKINQRSDGFEKQVQVIDDIQKNRIAVLDYGIKDSIIQYLTELEFELDILPFNTQVGDIDMSKYDGIFLSNGPGDPAETFKITGDLIKFFVNSELPIFGICLGHQLLAEAFGLKTVKMYNGHRGANHPVKNLLTSKIEITSQNHGFSVENIDIPDEVEITHISLFDHSIEGMRLKNRNVFSVQYHPESSAGPHDSRDLFLQFYQYVEEYKKSKD